MKKTLYVLFFIPLISFASSIKLANNEPSLSSGYSAKTFNQKAPSQEKFEKFDSDITKEKCSGSKTECEEQKYSI
jgi:hypothetical protein